MWTLSWGRENLVQGPGPLALVPGPLVLRADPGKGNPSLGTQWEAQREHGSGQP